MWRLSQTRRSHRLSDAGDRVVQQCFHRLRGNVARTQARAAGQDDEVGIGHTQPFANLALDVGQLVTDDGSADDVRGDAGQRLADLFATLIDALTTGTLGAHRQHAGTKAHA